MKTFSRTGVDCLWYKTNGLQPVSAIINSTRRLSFGLPLMPEVARNNPTQPSPARLVQMVKKVITTLMPQHLQLHIEESNQIKQSLALCSSEIFCIQQHVVPDFGDLIELVGDLEIHHKTPLPMFFTARDSPRIFTRFERYGLQMNRVKRLARFLLWWPSCVYLCNISSKLDFVALIKLMAGSV